MTTKHRAANGYNVAIVAIVALGSFTYGFNNSIIGSVFGMPGFFEYFASTDTDTILGASNGTFFGGAIIGCLVAAALADRLGRVRCFQIVCLICLVGCVLQAAAVHVAMFMIGRAVTGLASGMINSTVPLYQSEVAPPHIRGLMVGSHGTLLVLGYSMAGWSGYGCYFLKDPQVGWRLLLAFQAVAPGALLIATPFLPESPRWLIYRDHHERAETVLRKLHSGVTDDGGHDLVRDEIIQIRQQLEFEKTQPTSLLSMWTVPSMRRRMLTGLAVQFLCQSTGCLVINNYSVILYNSLGLYGSLPLLLYALYLLWATFMNFVSALIVDRLGRIRSLAIGFGGCIAMLTCFTALVATYSGSDNKVASGFGVFFVFAFVGFYGGFCDAVSWIYCSEIFPTYARARGFAFSVSGFLATALVFTQSAPVAFTNVGWKYYLCFILINLVLGPILIWKAPETKGLSLEEIGVLFGDEIAVRMDVIHEKERQEMGLVDQKTGAVEVEKIQT